MAKKEKSRFKMPTAYTVLILIILVIAAVSLIIADPMIKKATIPNVVMSPILGFIDAIDVSLFVLVLGGFLGVINRTGVLYKGIASVVKKLNGKELFVNSDFNDYFLHRRNNLRHGGRNYRILQLNCGNYDGGRF